MNIWGKEAKPRIEQVHFDLYGMVQGRIVYCDCNLSFFFLEYFD